MRGPAIVISFVAAAAACGGATSTNLFGDLPDGAAASTSSTSGNASSTSGVVIGTSSSSGDVTTSSSSGTIPIDSGVRDDAGPTGRCNRNAIEACPPTEYCKVEGCGSTGVCTARPAPGADLEPVCGCDGVTYWNASLAASRGMSFSVKGACGANGVSCTRETGCTGDAKCNLEQPAVCQAVGQPKGTCWHIPNDCDGVASRLVRRCNNLQCTSFCEAIDDERQFTPGAGCP